ncbi:MAG: hypothetical protein ACREIV_09590, partial [Planctomycetaceae bacterium]
VGQASVLYVGVPGQSSRADRVALVEEAFIREYRNRYHRADPDGALEVVSLRALVSGPRPDLELKEAGAGLGDGSRALKGRREIYLPEAAGFVSCPVYDRYALTCAILGPAVIEERESTAIVGPEARIDIHPGNNLLVTMPESRKSARRIEPQKAAVGL